MTGFSCPVDIKPYAISVSVENDGNSSTNAATFTFYVKVTTSTNADRSDIVSFNSTNTNAGTGGLVLDRLSSKYDVLFNTATIPAGRSFGIYYTATANSLTFASEICVKLYCSQV